MSSGTTPMPAETAGKISEKDSVILKRVIHAASIIINARTSFRPEGSEKMNNWFNLSTDMASLPKEQLKPWRAQDVPHVPPLVVETYLDLRDIHPKQKLYVNDREGNAWFVTKGKRRTEVVLERWLFELDSEGASPVEHVIENSSTTSDDSSSGDERLALIYKQCIVLFRDLYTYVYILPATQLKKTIEEYIDHDKVTYQHLKVGSRILNGNQPISSKGRIGLSKELISSYANVGVESDDIRPHLNDEKFPSVATPFGTLKVSVQYRKDTVFYLNRRAEEPFELPDPKRLSLVSNSSSSPMSDYQHSPGSLDERKVAKAIPIVNRSSSNVSLAALLRNVKNNQSSTYNIGSYTAGMSIPKSFTSSYGGSLISNTYLPANAVAIPASQQQTIAEHQIGSVDSQPKYSSSFSSRHQLGQRKSLLLANNSQSTHMVSRNPSLDSRRYSDLEPPSQLFANDDIGDFIKSLDNKRDFSPNVATLNLNESLFRFKSMRTSTNLLGDSVSDSAVFHTNSPPPVDSGALHRSRLASISTSKLANINSNSPIANINSNSPIANINNITMSHPRKTGSPVYHHSASSIGADHLPLVPSRLSGTYLPEQSRNQNSYDHSRSPSPPQNDLARLGYPYSSNGYNLTNYDIGSAPLPIIDNRLLNAHSGAPYSLQNNTCHIQHAKHHYNPNSITSPASPVSTNLDNKLIANRYKPHRPSENSQGINLPSLQSFVSQPSMAITTTTNAYAKMNDFPAPQNSINIKHRPESLENEDDDDGPRPEEYDANIDDDIIFPVHDIDLNKQ